MQLKQVPTVDSIDPEVFKNEFYEPGLPVVIKDLSKDWPAYTKWNWDYFKQLVGDKKVPLYNNVKSDAYTPINTADDYKTFGEYIDMISQGPAAMANFFIQYFRSCAPADEGFYLAGAFDERLCKKISHAIYRRATSITHMHFDIDLLIFYIRNLQEEKECCYFPFEEQHKLYRKPFEVLSLADFSNYHDGNGNT